MSAEVAVEGEYLLEVSAPEEALKEGKADGEPTDGNVMLREWLNYVVQRVPTMRQEQLRKQKIWLRKKKK